MSISKRLSDLARANVTDFKRAFGGDKWREVLDAREAVQGDDESASLGSKAGKRVRAVRDAAEEAWERAYQDAKQRAGVRDGSGLDAIALQRKWYRTLELDHGASLQDVRRAYRRLVRLYHPDRFANDPEKLRAATEVSRRLTEAYNGLSQLFET